MSNKRRREQPTVDVEAVEIYEDLAHEDEEIRLKAAQSLLKKVSDDKRPSHEELERILKRLFRGLCSSRKAARLGFSVALTEFLLQHVERPGTSEPELAYLGITEVVDVLEKQTHISGSVTGQVRSQSNPPTYRYQCNSRKNVIIISEDSSVPKP